MLCCASRACPNGDWLVLQTILRTILLREGQAIGVDECGQIGGNLRGDFLEFLAGGISAQLEASRWGVGGYGDDGAVARVIGGWVCGVVERVVGVREGGGAGGEQHL